MTTTTAKKYTSSKAAATAKSFADNVRVKVARFNAFRSEIDFELVA